MNSRGLLLLASMKAVSVLGTSTPSSKHRIATRACNSVCETLQQLPSSSSILISSEAMDPQTLLPTQQEHHVINLTRRAVEQCVLYIMHLADQAGNHWDLVLGRIEQFSTFYQQASNLFVLPLAKSHELTNFGGQRAILFHFLLIEID